MELSTGMIVKRLSLYLEKEKILVVGDIHMGYEEALNKQGILIPRHQLKETILELKNTLKYIKPEKIIILGDLKHEFGTISNQEWKDTLFLLDFLLSHAPVTLLKGNHDTILGPLARKRGLEIKDYMKIKNYFFCHGDKTYDDLAEFKKSKTIIIGHEHPAISIRDGNRVEKYKCFLFGKYKRKKLVVLPSFNLIVEGTDVLQERLLSPFIKNIDSMKAVIVSDKAYDFGPIKKIKKRLN